jgi:hypothetical protein
VLNTVYRRRKTSKNPPDRGWEGERKKMETDTVDEKGEGEGEEEEEGGGIGRKYGEEGEEESVMKGRKSDERKEE